jgi:hypothetical protein
MSIISVVFKKKKMGYHNNKTGSNYLGFLVAILEIGQNSTRPGNFTMIEYYLLTYTKVECSGKRLIVDLLETLKIP